MKNLPYTKLPQTWSNYLIGSTKNGIEINYLQKIIRKGVSYLPRSIFVTGVSGTGKSSLILLFIRSIRCLNRLEGDIEPCGYCSHCTSQDVRLEGLNSYTGIIWIQPGQSTEDTLYQTVKTALNEASKGHINTGNPNRDVLFVVIDEFQELSRDLRNRLLLRTELETPGKNVCYIFLTMRPDTFNPEDLTALSRRGICIHLGLSSADKIQSYLLKEYPSITAEAAKIISNGCQGRPGLATSFIWSCLDKFGEVTEDTAHYVINTIRNDWRWTLWELIHSNDKNDFQRIIELIKYFTEETSFVTERTLNLLLQDDIMYSVMETNILNSAQEYALKMLSQQLLTGTRLGIVMLQLKNLGERIVTEKGVMRGLKEEVMKNIERGD